MKYFSNRIYHLRLLNLNYLKSLILGLFLLPILAYTQDLGLVSKVSLTYKVGHYNFGETGHYQTEEITEFIRTSNNQFLRHFISIDKHFIKDSVLQQNNFSISDTLKNRTGPYFSIGDFKNLVDNLNKTKNNFQKEEIGPFLPKIKKAEILSQAKLNEQEFYFTDDETGKIDESGRELIKKIKSYDSLDRFLEEKKPDLEYVKVVVDVWKSLLITFYEKEDTIKFYLPFYDLLGQPFEKFKNKKDKTEKRFINIEVNKILSNLVPSHSLTQKAISIESLKEDYINWYIDRLSHRKP